VLATYSLLRSTSKHHRVTTYPSANCAAVEEKRGPDRNAEWVDVAEAMARAYPPALGTAEIAERLGVVRQTADRYLREMEEAALVEGRMVGTVKIWWLTDAGKRLADPEER
jgi:DNA-binding MarR family transcriptional regulator